MSVNMVILVGNLGADPEIKTTQNGKLATFNVATSENWKDKRTNEWQQKTEWHRVVVYADRLVTKCEKLRKGSTVYLQGMLQTRQWQDQKGDKRYTTEVVLKQFGSNMEFMENRGGRGNDAPPDDSHHSREDDRGGYSPGVDDEVPF